MADMVWLRGCHLEHHHLRDEDNDSPPNCEHDLQYPVHHLRIFRRHIPHAGTQPRAPAAQHIAPTPDAEIDSGRRGCRIDGETSIDWLKPFMSRRSFRRGDIVFRKGDTADAMFYSVTGRYRLKEMGIEIPAGHVFGDLGFLAPDNRRTQTIECTEDGEVLTATYQQVKELYFQNPQFGFFFMRLTSERLFDNIKRLEQEIVRKNEVIAELGGKAG